jgi:hypothetical protein
MKFKLTCLSVLLRILFLPTAVFCQAKDISGIDFVAGEWIKNIRASSGKKTLLRTDKYVYRTGDTVRFKVYITDSASGKLTSQKGMLYVDLVDASDAPIKNLFLHSSQLNTSGVLTLPDSIHTGYYWIRSYSQLHQKKNEASDMCIIPLLIINPRNSSNRHLISGNRTPEKISSSQKIVAEIFPEGGAYMSGENNKIVIKVHDDLGNPLAVSGVVRDAQAKDVSTFTTNNSGLGKFIYSPTSKGKYNLYIKSNKGYDSIMGLPKVNLKAAQISVTEQTKENVKVKVLLEDSIFDRNYTSYILAVSRDSLCYAAVGQGMYELNISLQNFPAGIAHLLLFNNLGQLLSGRDIYLQDKEPIVSIRTNKKNFNARDKADLDISVTDASGKPVQATLSVSVADAKFSDTSSMLFETAMQNDSFQDIDMVMISNPIRNPMLNAKEKISAESAAPSFNPFVYEGQLMSTKKKPLENYEIFMINNQRNLILLKDTTDKDGRFSIALPEFDGKMEYSVKVKNLKGSTDNFLIVPEYAKPPVAVTPDELKNNWLEWEKFLSEKVQKNHLDTLFTVAGEGVLSAVTVSKKLPNSNRGEAGYLINQEQLLQNGMNNVGLALLNIPGVHLNSGYLVIGGYVAFTPSETDEPILVLDGVQTTVPPEDGTQSPILKYLNGMSVREIEYIKVLTGAEASIYGLRGGHGVIEIKTSSKLSQSSTGKDDLRVFVLGYQEAVPFSGQDYSDRTSSGKDFIDAKSTRFWNADLVTDKLGKAKAHFFMGDKRASYVVTVAGFTANGEKIFKTVVINMNDRSSL